LPPQPNPRNGNVYPDPFPFDPPSREEAEALKLTPPQRIALEHLLLGSQLSVAARIAGVTRMTLYRWLHRDPNFQAAFNTWQADAYINSRMRTLGMLNSATTTVEVAVQTDPRVAVAVLKAAGILHHALPGPTEPDECQRQIELNDQRSQQQTQTQVQAQTQAPPAGTIFYASVAGFTQAATQHPAENRPHPTAHLEQQATPQELEKQPTPPNGFAAAIHAQQISDNQPA
jgi:hypothetical protein